MSKKILLSLFVLSGLFIKAQFIPPYVVPNKDWVRYNSPHGSVGSSPNALDVNGNVYSTGYSGLTTSADLVVFKYDSLGVSQYTVPYDNGGYDCGTAIKIDLLGYAYVAGTSAGTPTGLDYVVLKLSPAGSIIWTKRFDGGFNNGDEATAICADVNGDVYVTGKSQSSMGDYNIVTLKLDGNTGNTVWQHTFAGAGNMDDVGTAMVLSDNGQYAYITGSTASSGTGADIVTYAIDLGSGSSYWPSPVITNGSANSTDKGNAIIFVGNDVFIAGEVINSGTGLDYKVMRYDGSNGSIIWQQDYDFSGVSNRATALARDSAGNIGVVGTVLNGSIYEYHTVLYNNSGTQYATNIESTNLGTSLVDPKICNDTIAHHWYVCGQKLNTSKDMFVYQVTPSGNTSWRQYIDGQNNDQDLATAIAVNGVGVVYVGGHSKNSSANYDYTTVKINQTPVYFPPDLTTTDPPNVSHLYYENKGQILRRDSLTPNRDILFSTMAFHPNTYFTNTKFSYKFASYDTTAGSTDTIQRIDVTMIGANELASAYPFVPKQGKASFMQEPLPVAVIGVQGYERYFIPNIYPSIDLQYYSNSKGLKMYYVLKPGANPKNIVWQIDGSTSNSIVSNKLLINAFNDKVEISQPKIYTVDMSGNPVTVTTTVIWNSLGSNKYDMTIGTYSTYLPYIVEIDYGTTIVSTPSGVNNLLLSTYYGGWGDEGFRTVEVDQRTGDYVVVGEVGTSLDSHVFPVITGSTVSSSSYTNSGGFLLSMILFDQYGQRKAVNTYGPFNMAMKPVGGVVNHDYITIVGNTSSNVSNTNLPVINSSGSLTAGTYSNVNGDGFIMQFHFNPFTQSINAMTWRSRLNGFATGIAKTPDGTNLYVTSVTNYNWTADTKTLSGAYNNNSVNSLYQFQISKFDSLGIRKWSTIFPANNRQYFRANDFNFLNNNSLGSLADQNIVKCRIACDTHGFYIAGETDTTGLLIKNTYSVSCDSSFNGRTDAFFARFNKKDNLVYSTYVGGADHDAFADIAVAGSKEAIMVGYSNSRNYKKITTLPTGTNYVDSTTTNSNSKILITKFDTIGNKTWSTFWGANNAGQNIIGWGVASDLTGKSYITGKSLGNSMDFPVNNVGAVYSNTVNTNTESFMLAFENVLNFPIWNTAFGGKREDDGLGVAYDSQYGTVILIGLTNTSFSTVPTEQPWFPIQKNQNNPYAYFQGWINGAVNGIQTSYDGYISTFVTAVITGIKEYFTDKNNLDAFNLFPNPAQNECNMAFKQALNGTVKIEVFNQMGQLVSYSEKNNLVPYSVLNFNIQSLPTGIYIVKVSTNESSSSKKLIISK